MSSGACRALVAALLSLTIVAFLAVPVAANTDQLVERSTVMYTVNPRARTVDVSILIPLRNRQETPYQREPWGPVVVEEAARQLRLSDGFTESSTGDVPGPWKAITVKTPVIAPGEGKLLGVTYTLDADRGDTPVRVDDGYLYFCVVGQDTDEGTVEVKINGRDRYELTQVGTPLELTGNGLKSSTSSNPADIFTCIEGTVAEALEVAPPFIGPGGREIQLQAAPTSANWLQFAERNVEPALDDIAEFLGHDMPGQGPIIIRQSPSRELGGHASAHDTPGIVQLDDRAGSEGAVHEVAHAWFGADNVTERWLREGLAEWIATSMAGAECEPVSTDSPALDLSEWQVVRPTAPEDIDEIMQEQLRAACGIVSAMRARMGDEQWQGVLAALLEGDTKYNGSSGGTQSTQTTIDYREWLDAIDEIGLVPAAASDEAFADNLSNLDYAQDLLAAYDIPADPGALEQRSAARAAYHEFLAEAGGLAAPLAVRRAMDDWEFDDAMVNLEKSHEVLASLQEADALLPDAELIPLIQPMFEAAGSSEELDVVLERAQVLLAGASEVVGSLNELQAALPEGWNLPAAISNAIVDERFADIEAAIAPAFEVVEGANAANAVLPEAGLLDKYGTRFQGALTATALKELGDEVEDEFAQAQKAGSTLRQLETAAGDWTVPALVTAAIQAGQVEEAIPVLEDALAVVTSTRAGDTALPEADLASEFRPRFEALTSAEELDSLRGEVETRAGDAQAVGSARAALNELAAGWREPVLLQDLIEQRDFAAAARVAGLAANWITDATAADASLPQMKAMERVRPAYESASTIAELEAGAKLAEDWSIAAGTVASVVDRAQQPLDLLGTMGLWGSSVDVKPAIDAAVVGDVQGAIRTSAAITKTLNDASAVGGLRLAGIIFFVVAIVGVAGLWFLLRREAGPPWARQRKPHWLKDEGKPRGGGRIGGGRNKVQPPPALGPGRGKR